MNDRLRSTTSRCLARRSMTVSAVIIAALLSLRTPSFAMSDTNRHLAGAGPVTFHIDDGTLDIKAHSYESWTFDVPNSKAGCLLSGKISVLAGGEKDVAVLVLTNDQFTNWQNHHQAQVFFSTGRETVIPLSVTMKGSGKYVLVVSNTFSMLTAKTIQTQGVQLHCGL